MIILGIIGHASAWVGAFFSYSRIAVFSCFPCLGDNILIVQDELTLKKTTTEYGKFFV